MAATYVYALDNPGSKKAHLGSDRRTACGILLPEPVAVSDDMPTGRTLCPLCLADAAVAGAITTHQMLAMLRYVPDGRPIRGYSAEDAAVLVSFYKQGFTDQQIANRLGIGLRTVVRHSGYAMSKAGAKSRFQWGYLAGLAEGRAGL